MNFYTDTLSEVDSFAEINKLIKVLKVCTPDMVKASIAVAYQRKGNEELSPVTSTNVYRDSDDTFVLTMEVRVHKYDTEEYKVIGPFVDEAIKGADSKLRIAQEAEMAVLVARHAALEAEIEARKNSHL
jgi:hypothetical protein